MYSAKARNLTDHHYFAYSWHCHCVSHSILAADHITHLQQECHNSKFSIFELLVLKDMIADALLAGIVS